MKIKYNINQRTQSIQGLRSFKDTLPKNVRKIIGKRGHIFSEILNNWKYIVNKELFKICYPKSFKNSNNFSPSHLTVMVKRGHEVDLEYSKKDMIEKINAFFGYNVIKKIKLLSFDERPISKKEDNNTNEIKYKKDYKTLGIKNYRIKKLQSLSNYLKKK